MGKTNKRQKQKHSNHHDNPARNRNTVVRRQHSQPNPSRAGQSKTQHKASQPGGSGTQHRQQQHTRPKIPFQKQDSVLLIGEGDFSFSASLVRNHEVGSVVATCFDDKATLLDKYPGVTKTIRRLQPSALDMQALNGDSNGTHMDTQPADMTGTEPNQSLVAQPENSLEGNSDTDDHDGQPVSNSSKTTVLWGIDATKLNKAHRKSLKQHMPFTKIVFNFPHVGGLSTDVNRQVRSNQQLLVGFFNAAKPLLATSSNPARNITAEKQDSDTYNTDDESEGGEGDSYDHDHGNRDEDHRILGQGQILVTLFEGEPYTLWNIRDLARHCGLKVVESFRFPWEAYPGYHHARTIGDITTGKDRSDEGKRKGAWRGEERDARCYVLALNDPASLAHDVQERAKRKKQHDEDSDSD